MFKDRVTNITYIAKRDHAVFPLIKVVQAIDGQAAIRGHGNPIPAFPNRYRAVANGGNAMSQQRQSRVAGLWHFRSVSFQFRNKPPFEQKTQIFAF